MGADRPMAANPAAGKVKSTKFATATLAPNGRMSEPSNALLLRASLT